MKWGDREVVEVVKVVRVVEATISDTLTQRWRRCPECGYRYVTVELPNYDDSIKEYIKDVFGEEITKNGV